MRERLVAAFLVLALLSGGLLGGRALAAQRRGPILIGVLTESWGPTPPVGALRDGLQEMGYRENEDFALGVRFTQGDVAALPVAARELVQLGADVLIASGGGHVAKAAQEATSQLPIIFIGSSDPVALGLVKTFNRPGGNITGIADLDIELVPKRLEIFREIIPGLKRVLLPYDATDNLTVSHLNVYRDAARRLGVTLVEKPVRTQEEAGVAITGARRGAVDGILSPRFVSLNIPGFMLDATTAQRIPTMFHGAWYVRRGGLAGYGASEYELGKQAARLLDKILKGAKPGDLPIEQPTKFELVINLKTATALGLTIPPSLLQRADQLIE
jgi:putative ABC transport system substrate-binding protein